MPNKGYKQTDEHRQKLVKAHTGLVVKHGLTGTKFYRAWQNIQSRCNNENHFLYKNYGARGIKCEWENFESFMNDMLVSFEQHVQTYGNKQTLIDRIDVNGNYSKKNCRWLTASESSNNRRDTFYIIVGERKYPFTEFCKLFGVEDEGQISKFRTRARRGKDVLSELIALKLSKQQEHFLEIVENMKFYSGDGDPETDEEIELDVTQEFVRQEIIAKLKEVEK